MENDLLEANEVFLLIVVGVIIMLSLAFALVLFFYAFQKRLLSQKVKAQEELVYNTLHAQEEERQRIARELHDEIGSKLNVIHLYLHQLKKKQNTEKEFDSTLTSTKDVLQKVIGSSREIAHFLMPVTLEKFGFFTALEELCHEFEGTGAAHIHVKKDQVNRSALRQEIELDLFRIFQELMNNSFKHAQAKNIYIEISNLPQQLLLSYKDDGKGFDMEKIAAKKSLGMKNIRTRLRSIGADYDLQSSEGNGVHLTIKINE